jgi:hypothetical protein
MSSSPESGRVQKGTANVVEMVSTACKSRAVFKRPQREQELPEAGHRRCHGEDPGADASILKAALKPSVRKQKPRKRIHRPSTAACGFSGCVYPQAGTPHPCPGSGCGLHDQGQSCPPKAPRVDLLNEGTLYERPSREGGQAVQSGKVSSRGRSSHSSPSTGKPCTWRRGAASE